MASRSILMILKVNNVLAAGAALSAIEAREHSFYLRAVARLEGKAVTANALHPGFVKTTIFRESGPLAWLMRRASDLIALSPEDGARTSIYLASSPEVAGISGRYFVKEKQAKSSPQSHEKAAAQRLWQLSEEMTEIKKL